MGAMTHKFFCGKLDKKVKTITSWMIIAFAVTCISIYMLNENSGYILAWFISIALAFVALYALSMPRYVTVDQDAIEIHCVLEMSRIELGELKEVRRISPRYLKHCYPVLGSYGFLGYFGYYYHLGELEMIKMYATQLRRLVLIEDIYEQRYIVSCTDAQKFIETINLYRRAKEETK